MKEDLYQGGVPNPKLTGSNTLHGTVRRVVDAEAIGAVSKLLGTAARYTDHTGTQHEIIAALQSYEALAWVESRARREGQAVHVVFELNVRMSGKPWLQLELPTYNPYFGCTVGYLGWHDKRLVVVYREKAHSIVGAFSPGSVSLRTVGEGYELADGFLWYKSDEPGLMEIVRLPGLATLCPVPALMIRNNKVPIHPMPPSPLDFQLAVRKAYFGDEPPQPDADFLIGAFGHRFWLAGRNVVSDYRFAPHWNSPGDLAFEFYQNQSDRLARVMAPKQQMSSSTSPISLCSFYLFVRQTELARKLAQRQSPGRSFWSPPSLRLFEADKPQFLPGFLQVLESLRQRH